jgi:hypothetical protein
LVKKKKEEEEEEEVSGNMLLAFMAFLNRKNKAVSQRQ